MSEANTSRVSRESLRISSVHPQGWQQPEAGHVPSVGDTVYCTEGPAEVARLLGRTSDGSRLLELRCAERTQAFFASSTNVLVRASSSGDPSFLQPADAVGGS